MRLLAFSEGADHVCYRYRVAPFARALARAGWQLECEPLVQRQGWLARRRQLRGASRADAVLLQRRLLPLWQLRTLRRSARRLVFDFDDAVFHRDSYHRKGIESWHRAARFWNTVYAADLVLAGNRFLFDQAAALVGSERVRLFPTCVEPRHYRTAPHTDRRPLRLAWIGQRTTLPSLYCMREQLETSTTRCSFELRVVSDVFPTFDSVRIVPLAWSAETETDHLAESDVGISWLPDDGWSRGKCGLKVLQYMAAGLPVVANRVGVHREMIVDGVTGYLADTPLEWTAALRRLADDASLRAAMGAAGRRRVENEYSVARWETPFAAAIDGLASSATGTPVPHEPARPWGLSA
ncbi:MAG TPA: glycosyltransferase family 4 protein [Pirellulales bacterium]|nr:glycosyltransferase family 4 protein [Pirellulales bacterium]